MSALRQTDDRALQADTTPPRCAACGAEGCMELGVFAWHCTACRAADRPEHPILAAERHARRLAQGEQP